MKEKDKHGYFSKIQIFFSDLRLLLSIIIWTKKKKFIGNSKASQQQHDFIIILTINTCCCLMMLLLSSYLLLPVLTVEMAPYWKKNVFFSCYISFSHFEMESFIWSERRCLKKISRSKQKNRQALWYFFPLYFFFVYRSTQSSSLMRPISICFLLLTI